MAQIFGKWLRYKRHALSMASMCGKRLKYLRNCFTMLEITQEFDKRLIDVGNDVCMCEMT